MIGISDSIPEEKVLKAGNLPDLKRKRTEDIFYAGLFVILAFCIMSFYYSDFMDTLDNSVMLAESIIKGEFRNFYQYAAEHAHPNTVYAANYNIIMYLIFMVWNFPTVLMHLITGADYMNNLFAIFWCKGIVCAGIAACAVAVKKIVEGFTRDMTDVLTAAFMFLASTATLLSAFIAVQYDCIMLALVLWGIWLYAKGDRKKALILFSLAVPLKTLALFAVIPVILVYEKKILRAVTLVLITMIPQTVAMLPFLGEKTCQMAIHSQNNDAVNLLMNGANVGNINLFLLLFTVVCIVCYVSRNGKIIEGSAKYWEKTEDNPIGSKEAGNNTDALYLSVFACFIVFWGFCFFTSIRSYWLILFVPFMEILLFARKDNRFICLLLELGSGLAGGLYYLIHHHIYSMDGFTQKLFLRIFALSEGMEERYGSIRKMLDSIGMLKYEAVLLAAAVACLVCFTVYRIPRAGIRWTIRSNEMNSDNRDNEKLDFQHMIIRLCVMVCVIGLFLYSKMAAQPVICAGFDFNKPEFAETYNEVTDEVEPGSQDRADIMKVETSGIKQEVVFTNSRDLSAFEIMFEQVGYKRNVRSFLYFELYDSDGHCIWQDKIGMTEIGNMQAEKVLRIKMNGIHVEAQKTYSLKISRSSPHPEINMEAYVCLDKQKNVKYNFR